MKCTQDLYYWLSSSRIFLSDLLEAVCLINFSQRSALGFSAFGFITTRLRGKRAPQTSTGPLTDPLPPKGGGSRRTQSMLQNSRVTGDESPAPLRAKQADPFPQVSTGPKISPCRALDKQKKYEIDICILIYAHPKKQLQCTWNHFSFLREP